jgi:uncharacterized protein (DUF169 family)
LDDHDWQQLATDLVAMLRLDVPPVALSFVDQPPDDVRGYPAPMTDPTPDGRSGRAPASCVFWMEAADGSFSTVAADHGNCSVGRWVHGFATPDDIIDKHDVRTLLDTGWVTTDAIGGITTVAQPTRNIVYGPLGATPAEPDVVLVQLTPRQMMELGDACPHVELSGKPQCQIVAKAKEHGVVASSMGCALSRQRTDMPDNLLACAIPGHALPSIIDRLRQVVRADGMVRAYAAGDGATPS